MIRSINALWLDESAATLVEYAIIAASFSILMVAALLSIQDRTGVQLTSTATGITSFEISPP